MERRTYNIAELLQMQACTRCQACVEVCPAVAGSLDGRLSAKYRIEALGRILRRRSGFWRRIFRRDPPTAEAMRAFSETVFRCTLCGNCRRVCPVGIDLTGLWHSLRRDLVDSKSYPPRIDMIRENMAEAHNVFGEDNEARTEWVEDMPDAPDHGYVKERADIVYFTGCVSSFFPLARRIPMALAGIFDAAGVDFTLLGQDEWCCGFPLLGAGLGGHLDALIENNVNAVKARGAKQVVFACPSCYRMWHEHYPPRVGIAHVTEFLSGLVGSGRLKLHELDLTVTYHDPCDLGRGAGQYDAPRQILRAIPGVRLVELAACRGECSCCGGGGNLEMIDAGLSARIAGNKIEEVRATGAQAVVTACQQCVRTMTTYVKRNKVPIQVLDIVQLLHMSVAGGDRA